MDLIAGLAIVALALLALPLLIGFCFAVVVYFRTARALGEVASARRALARVNRVRPTEATIIYDKEHQRP